MSFSILRQQVLQKTIQQWQAIQHNRTIVRKPATALAASLSIVGALSLSPSVLADTLDTNELASPSSQTALQAVYAPAGDSTVTVTFTKVGGSANSPDLNYISGSGPVAGLWLGSGITGSVRNETYELEFSAPVTEVQLTFAAINYNVDGIEESGDFVVLDGATDITASSSFNFNDTSPGTTTGLTYGPVLNPSLTNQSVQGVEETATVSGSCCNDNGTLTVSNPAGFTKVRFTRTDTDNTSNFYDFDTLGNAAVPPRQGLNNTNGTTLGPIVYTPQPTAFDYGDAPDTYGTTAASGGPSHTIVSGLHLGTAPDSESDAATPLDGSGDGTEDDGITLATLTEGDTSYSIPAASINATGTGTLHAWVDFNKSGTFEPGEHTSVNVTSGMPSSALNWSGITAGAAGDTYARFRFTSDTSITLNTPGGAASDGEVEDYQVAIANDQFACPRAFYQIINNQLKKLDPLTGDYLDVGSPAVAHYNATGYNPVDDFIYGYGRGGSINNRLVKIAQDGTLTNLGVPTKVGGVGTLSDAHSGDFDDSGNLWLRTTLSGARIFQLNVTTNEYIGFALSQNLPNVADWVYINGKLYGGFDRTLYIIDLSNQTLGTTLPVTTVSVPDLPAGATFGAGYTDVNNNLYLSDNAGALYQVLDYDTSTPTAAKLVNTTATSFNDGMSCPDALPPFDFDFGDAPDTTAGNGPDNYSTLLSDSGPFHLIDPNLSLGSGVTPDVDGFGDGTDNNSNASDDTDDAFGALANIPATGTYDLTNIPVNNANSATATLHAWIDFDKNGQFAVSEYQSVSVPQGTATVDLSWPIPGGTTDGTTYARFRLTTDSDLTDTAGTTAVDERSIGSASGGEVEDYQVAIQPISTNPNVVLVERITAINGNRTQNPNDNTLLNAVVNDSVANSADDQSNWPASYLVGAIDGGLLQPGDKIERTVYFLNTGINHAASVRICDWIQPYESFLTGVYAGNDIELVVNGTTYQLTAASDAADRAELATVGSLPAGPTCNLPAAATNVTDEVLVLDITGTTGDPTGLTTLPGTTGQGTPTNAYGFFRFTTKVDE